MADCNLQFGFPPSLGKKSNSLFRIKLAALLAITGNTAVQTNTDSYIIISEKELKAGVRTSVTCFFSPWADPSQVIMTQARV